MTWQKINGSGGGGESCGSRKPPKDKGGEREGNLEIIGEGYKKKIRVYDLRNRQDDQQPQKRGREKEPVVVMVLIQRKKKEKRSKLRP